jgi:hypothetical protein
MAHHDIKALEKQVTELSAALAHLGSADDMKELLRIIRGPGWTTIAEFLLVASALESISGQARILTTQRQQLLAAAREVKPEEAFAASK